MARKSRKNLPQPEQAAASVLLPELEELPELLFPESLPEMEESVFAPATPSAVRPFAFWNALTAASVLAP